MFDDFIETLKLVGAVVGLLTGAFVVYDRMVRSRPMVYLGPREFKAYLFFRNMSEETIVIDEVQFKPEGMLKIDKANDLITANEERAHVMYPSMADKEDTRFEGTYIVLKGLEERSFSLNRFASFENSSNDTAVKIKCRWETTRSWWPISRHVTIRTTVGKIKRLREAAVAGKR